MIGKCFTLAKTSQHIFAYSFIQEQYNHSLYHEIDVSVNYLTKGMKGNMYPFMPFVLKCGKVIFCWRSGVTTPSHLVVRPLTILFQWSDHYKMFTWHWSSLWSGSLSYTKNSHLSSPARALKHQYLVSVIQVFFRYYVIHTCVPNS